MPQTLPPQLLLTALQLGQHLKAARKRRQLTQTDVASRLGLSQNRISHLERHPEEMSFKQLLSWCSIAGLELRIGERAPADGVTTEEW